MESSPAVIVPGKRLGKLPPKFDPRTLRMARYLPKRLPKVPTVHTLSKKTVAAFPSLGMFRNDALSDCTCASMGHAFQTWTTYGGKPWQPTDDQVVEVYGRVNGGQDNGANMLDVLNAVRKDGMGGQTIYAFIAVDPKNHAQVRLAHYLFGGLYFGAGLPVSAQAQENGLWDVVADPVAGAPYSWGGHAMNIVDTKAKELVSVTWGHLQRISWDWWDRYVDEAYAVLTEDYVGDDKRSPQGFSLAKLADDLKGL